MKVSLNWVRELSGVTTKTDELVELIGARLGAVDEVVDFGARYKDVVIVKVIECQKHPDADKLHVCKVDDKGVTPKVKRDSKGLIQVVCGAPNVRAGMLAAWIPPGATVPSTIGKDPLVIESKELRGEMSHGMLASAAELDLGDDHSGLLELGSEAKAGATLAKTYDLDDVIIDIENKMFTHRPDCFGQLGVAREIAGITHKKFVSPGWYKATAKLPAGRGSKKIVIKNDIPKLVPRFVAVVIEDVQVGPSPIWLQTALTKLGGKPINNIVDITNYMMLLAAQPLHAYDYDKLATGTLGVRLSKDGESLKLLSGKTIKLKKGAMVITDGKKPVGLGGVMGGADTEVDANTKTIVLEAATFDMNLTRQSTYEYGLFTDAATRFTKGQSPLQNAAVAARAAELIGQVAGGKLGKSADESSIPKLNTQLGSLHTPDVVAVDFVNRRLGVELSDKEIVRLLGNVEFHVHDMGAQNEVCYTAPFWRTDIEIKEDIVEEIGRLYGYEHIPLKLPSRNIAPAPINPAIALKSKLRKILAEAGANEVLTYSFVSEDLLKKSGQVGSNAFKITNALSPDVRYYRLSLVPSLLDKVHSNIKSGYTEFALFEIGKGHMQGLLGDDKLPMEIERLALVLASSKPKAGAPYFAVRRICTFLLESLGIEGVAYKPIDAKGSKSATYYEPSRAAVLEVGGSKIGRVGEFNPTVKQAFKLPQYSAGLVLHMDQLIKLATSPKYEPLNRFPSVEQDLCLKSAANVNYQQLTHFVKGQLETLSKPHGYKWQVEPIDIYQKDKSNKQTTWRISLSHPERTLTTQETNQLLDDLAKAAQQKLKAERI